MEGGKKGDPSLGLSSQGTLLMFLEESASLLTVTRTPASPRAPAEGSREIDTAQSRPPTKADFPILKACPSHKKGFVFFFPRSCAFVGRSPPAPRRVTRLHLLPSAHTKEDARRRYRNLRACLPLGAPPPGAARRCHLAAADGTAPWCGQMTQRRRHLRITFPPSFQDQIRGLFPLRAGPVAVRPRGVERRIRERG